MALDSAFFDSIALELVKKKYYNAGKVGVVLEEIKRQAFKLNEENSLLTQKLEKAQQELQSLKKQKEEMNTSLASARLVYDSIVEKAEKESERILEKAHKDRERIAEENVRQQDYAVKCVQECISLLREQQLKNIELINEQWQNFLCGLSDTPDTALPYDDLGEKLEGIKSQIDSINEKE